MFEDDKILSNEAIAELLSAIHENDESAIPLNTPSLGEEWTFHGNSFTFVRRIIILPDPVLIVVDHVPIDYESSSSSEGYLFHNDDQSTYVAVAKKRFEDDTNWKRKEK